MRALNTKSRFDQAVIIMIAVAYCMNRFWLKKVVSNWTLSYLLNSHFNDWLAGISIVAYINLILSKSKYTYIRIKNCWQAIVVCLCCGLLWEYVLPYLVQRGISDKWDVLAYILGGVTYIALRVYFIMRSLQ